MYSKIMRIIEFSPFHLNVFTVNIQHKNVSLGNNSEKVLIMD